MEFISEKFSVLDSERLLFKKLSNDDIDFIQYYLSDEERTRYLPLGNSYSKHEAEDWLKNRVLHWEKNNFGVYLLLNRESEKAIGYCGIEFVMDSEYVEICYGLTQDSWGKGYALEAALLMIKHGLKTLHLKTIYGAVVPGNSASKNILKKCGMVEDNSFNLYGNSVESFSINVEKRSEIWKDIWIALIMFRY
jgi:ribosomal-protein-alanine N-acetyltransferase